MALFRRRRSELPDRWPTLAAQMVVGRPLFDAEEAETHDALTAHLLDQVRWESARGFELTDEMRLVVCGNAALLALGTGPDVFRLVKSVIIHDGTITVREPRPGRAHGTMTDEPSHLAGEAHDGRGPILLSWRDARYEARHPATGRNVVIHEFAHKLDMADGLMDGTPPIADADLRRRWIDVCTLTFGRLQSDEPDEVIRDYAGTNPTEFFAVIAELFFCRPIALREHHPALYALVAEALRQDPADRLDRAIA